jgi:hypothetical protein
MKAGNLARIRDIWRPFGSNTKNYLTSGDLVLIVGLLDDEISSIFKVLSSKGVVHFYMSYLEVLNEVG